MAIVKDLPNPISLKKLLDMGPILCADVDKGVFIALLGPALVSFKKSYYVHAQGIGEEYLAFSVEHMTDHQFETLSISDILERAGTLLL